MSHAALCAELSFFFSLFFLHSGLGFISLSTPLCVACGIRWKVWKLFLPCLIKRRFTPKEMQLERLCVYLQAVMWVPQSNLTLHAHRWYQAEYSSPMASWPCYLKQSKKSGEEGGGGGWGRGVGGFRPRQGSLSSFCWSQKHCVSFDSRTHLEIFSQHTSHSLCLQEPTVRTKRSKEMVVIGCRSITLYNVCDSPWYQIYPSLSDKDGYKRWGHHWKQ